MSSSEDWHGFWIGQQRTLCLRVSYLKPMPIPSAEFTPVFRAEAIAPGFKADFDFVARLGEFEMFRDQVKRMYETLGVPHISGQTNIMLV